MALFKILRGPSNEFEANLNAADLKPVFKDGYCYFLTGSNMFFVDYEKDNVAYRVPLNAQNAHTLSLTTEDEDGNPLLVEGYTLVDTLTNNDGEIPTSHAVYTKTNILASDIADLQSDKMDKVNPTGSGAMSVGRKANTTIGDYSSAIGYNLTASGTGSHAEGRSNTASGTASHAEG